MGGIQGRCWPDVTWFMRGFNGFCFFLLVQKPKKPAAAAPPPKPRSPQRPVKSEPQLQGLAQLEPKTESSPPRPNKLPLPPYRPVSPRAVPPPAAQPMAQPRAPIIIRHVTPAQVAPTTPTPPRRIFRFYDTLFTEDARPVRLDPNGAVVYLPPESVPLGHRQMARQMIERFRASAVPPPPPAVRPAAP